MTSAQSLPNLEWEPPSWQRFAAAQQPLWPDAAALESALAELRSFPPLVFAGEARTLRATLARVAEGKGFLLHAGDCAESFADFSADNIRDKLKVILQMSLVLTYSTGVPTLKVGRIAGQFAKPRSSPIEKRDGVELPSYLGDMVNDFEFEATARRPDPQRMVRGYHQAAATLNLLRAFTKGGFADLRGAHQWNLEFIASRREGKRYDELAQEIDRALRFMTACGIDLEHEAQLHEVDFYTSHEALLLGYEEALTRRDSITGDWYDCSAHLLWIGHRTHQIDGAHVEFLSGVQNPIGLKVGPDVTPEDLVQLCRRLDPGREPGRLTLVSRMGADNVTEQLPPLLRAIQRAGHPVVWACDPMHGNTYQHESGYKTRHFDAVMHEVEQFFAACNEQGVWPGGVLVELTGDNVTECLGGGDEVRGEDLESRYETLCDPRLNARQGLDLAFRLAELVRRERFDRMSDTASTEHPELGPNEGLVDEMYRLFQENPDAVSEGWRDFFVDYRPNGANAVAAPAPAPVPTPAPVSAPAPAPPARSNNGGPPVVLAGETAQPLRGAAARIVTNMEASLEVPTATSVRAVPAKLLEVNRQILNNHLARAHGGKVSFTHLIGFAVLRALRKVPAMNASFGVVDGTPSVARHEHVNLGLAIDLERPDGTRTLMVPNVKQADTLDFAAFHAAYEDLVHRARDGKLTADDLAGTTVTITNPGTIGTMHSVPRLMPGQGVIVGVGAIVFPPEYESADPQTLAELGVGKVVTLTSTYDHRIIQGAESGEMLAAIHDLLVGREGFYDDIFASLGIPYEPARWSQDHRPVAGSVEGLEKTIAVQHLVNMYRVRGHLIANLDPLGLKKPHTHPELDPIHWGLTIWDLEREFPTGGLAGQSMMKLRDILGVLRDAYARTIGVEYMHIQEPDQKTWIQEHVEGVRIEESDEDKRAILGWLNAAEAFERFLHTKFLGQKRFSLEGAETLIPLLAFLLDAAAEAGVAEIVMGMSHRGRLNVLANIVGKSYAQIFREFEGELDPNVPQGSGDVKYHVGATGVFTSRSVTPIGITLAANPSHLEAVDPVVEGMARAKQARSDDHEHNLVLPVLLHGDAAFAGQGVVAETLNLSELPGYDVGGTIHIVVNNQVGFTTTPGFARSTVYATDIAKAVQAPIFHVNGDDPEATVRVTRLAFAFRQEFKKDVVVDMVCYRRYGHNESDEPAFTQPRMYDVIGQRRSVRKLYTELLVNRGDLTLEEAEKALDDFRGRLEAAFEETRVSHPPEPRLSDFAEARGATATSTTETGVAREELERITDALVTFPPGFTVHPKLLRIIGNRRTELDEDRIDWSLAEALAFGSLLLENTPVRLAGQDTRRGTFSQRHAVLVDNLTEVEYTPLAHLGESAAPFMVYDSVLSEFAALGFEYGYSVADRDALVCWEAQFGDFGNGAQTIIDQFIVAAEDKWGERSGLVLLLPHGFEGQGPEHSSARLERFLVLCAQDNMRVVYPTTAAQYFHVLRRQVHDPERKPMIVMTPKRYLRMPATYSSASAIETGSFQLVLPDPSAPDPARVTRLVFCSGKFAHELIARRDEIGAGVAIVRLEQLYPWPEREIAAELARYEQAEVIWAQEEPGNMGARYFARRRIEEMAGGREVGVVARPASPSPATGSSAVHDAQQQALLEDAIPTP